MGVAVDIAVGIAVDLAVEVALEIAIASGWCHGPLRCSATCRGIPWKPVECLWKPVDGLL